MKTYLSVGIGDMVCLDSVLKQSERDNITEIYWACRFGKDLIPLFENNPYYPKLIKQHIIPDDVGYNAMVNLDFTAKDFWHFRPDFHNNYRVGLSLFGLDSKDVNAINAASIFMDGSRKFTNSSFLDSSSIDEVNWEKLKIKPYQYILFHYPTSTRPRSDIAKINDSDWSFIFQKSIETGFKIIVITDVELDLKFNNLEVLYRPNIKEIIALSKYCKIYAGCDSFVSILCSKILEPNNLYVKSHNNNIQNEILSNIWLQRFFQPHDPNTISKFYKNYIG